MLNSNISFQFIYSHCEKGASEKQDMINDPKFYWGKDCLFLFYVLKILKDLEIPMLFKIWYISIQKQVCHVKILSCVNS